MINVSLSNIDFSVNNITFVDGLTLETVKMKYHWLLNASVKDAIIGQDSYGLVWYFGEWFCGEWYDGTWYSGTWHDGVWKNGRWFAYNLDKFQVLSNNFNILERNDDISKFLNGIWENGTFYSGKFGVDSGTSWVDYELYAEGSYVNGDYPVFRKLTGSSGGNVVYDVKVLPTWLGGTFISGYMYDCVWVDGTVRYAEAKNIQWLTGKWFNGIFNGDTWWDGSWFNGNFIKGLWKYGTFTQMEQTIVSRFGNTTLSGQTECTWLDGTWRNGEFFSGIISDRSGNTLPSVNNYISIWENGTWMNGIWYGGHFKTGVWNNGVWKNGVFGNISSSEWVAPKYAFQVNDSDQVWSGRTSSTTATQIFKQIDNYTENGIRVASKSPSVSYDNYESFASFEYTAPNYNTYFQFNFIDNDKLTSYNTGGTVFSVGMSVYVVCDKYTGYAKVTQYVKTSSIKYIKVDKISGIPFYNSIGKIYTATQYNNYISSTKTNILGFRDFEFNVTSGVKIRGYQVKYDRNDAYTGTKNGVFTDDITWFNVGVIRRTDNVNLNLIEYDPDFFDVANDTYVSGEETLPIDNILSGYKNKTKVDKNSREIIYGGFSDEWTLDRLNQYSGKDEVTSIVDATHKADITNLLNVSVSNPKFTNTTHLIDNVDEVTNLYIRYQSTYSDGKRMVISNVQMRVFFEDVSGVWNGGTWENGTWVNGQFNGGKFLAGLWLNGDFNAGQMGGLV